MKSNRSGLILVAGVLVSIIGCDGNGSSADLYYVALGASDATGVGADPLTDGYVFKIEDGLEDRGIDTQLTNLGIPGAEIDDIKDSSLKIAKLKDPDLITLFTGGNDLVGGSSPVDFESKLGEVLQDLRENTNAVIVIGTLPDATKAPRFIETPDVDVTSQRVRQFNDAILNQAAKYSVPIADLRGVDIKPEYTAEDGFHPSGEGYQVMADKFLEVIVPLFVGK